jgi:transcriptional regulator with XRE-family HTH domain
MSRKLAITPLYGQESGRATGSALADPVTQVHSHLNNCQRLEVRVVNTQTRRSIPDDEIAAIWADNLSRLMGMHRLSGSQASPLLRMSRQGISEWMTAKRMPTTHHLLAVGRFFEVPPASLVTSTFSELLAGPLGDSERFARVEKKIGRKPLKASSRRGVYLEPR